MRWVKMQFRKMHFSFRKRNENRERERNRQKIKIDYERERGGGNGKGNDRLRGKRERKREIVREENINQQKDKLLKNSPRKKERQIGTVKWREKDLERGEEDVFIYSNIFSGGHYYTWAM